MWKVLLFLAFAASLAIVSCDCDADAGCGGDLNAKKGCGTNCGRTCSTYQAKDKSLICPRIQVPCDVCFCKDGYVLDSNTNKCVLPQQCTPTCGLNEQYDSCTNGGCGHRNCSQLGKPQLCIDRLPESCTKGCRCVEGYLRADNGTCIPQEQCPAGCDDSNAQRGCGTNCGRTCSTYQVKNKTLICPRIPVPCNVCFCKDGYVLDSNTNKCVLPQNCSPTCGFNEQYDSCTNGGCGYRNCSQLGGPQICIDRTPESCTKGCRCVEGYLRADNGTCIPQDQCPTGCDGDPNAQRGCGSNCPNTCSTYKVVNKKLICPAIKAPCNVCLCKAGYVLDSNTNKCVLPQECTPTCGLNEQYDSCTNGGCGHKNCSQIGQPEVCIKRTPESCTKGCTCVEGYLRADNGTCVPTSQCPVKCGFNEFFDTCIAGCSNQTCDDIGKIYHCPLQKAGECKTGCRCNPGFWRNASNVCVSESLCPTPPCPQGEVYSRCPTVKCDGEYCPKTRDSPLTCPVGIVCDPPRCVCGFNSHRDRKTGKCIATASCPPFKCDRPNEEYKSCPASCPGDSCDDYIYSRTCPPFRIGIVVPCQPQCKCKQGYYRNSNGICVLGPQCGPKMNSTTPVIVPLDITTTTAATPASDDNKDNSGGNSSSADNVASLQAGVTKFNGEFLYDRMKASPNDNIITSPYSVFTPLAQLALYADGDSLKQLTNVLNVQNKEAIRSGFSALAASYDGQTSVNFSTAAKVYSNKDYPLSDGFKKDSVDVIHAEAQELDFNAPVQAADTINKWVESKTNNRIKDLIQSSDLSSLTRLVLVNAIYFKGDWLNSFNKNNTQDADFYLSDGTTKKTKLMYQQNQFNYGEVPELNCTVLEMLYKGKNFSMVIVLPNEKDGAMKTAQNLEHPANFKKALSSLSSQKVKVYVPPFEINTDTDLGAILKEEGVTKIFDQQDSGLSGLLKSKEDTYVSKAIQKAFIKVDETGSEAAAANGIGVGIPRPGPPPPPPVVFRADRAFLFYLRVQGSTMFCGAYSTHERPYKTIIVGVTSVFNPNPPKEIIFRCDRSFLFYILFKGTVLFAGAVVNPN